jgi:hypothetical protein
MKLVPRLELAIAALIGAGTLGATPAIAQSAESARSSQPGPFERYGGVPDRFNLRAGFLFATHSTIARVDSDQLGVGTLVDLETDLGLEPSTRDARVDGYVRLGRRHRIRAGYISLERGANVQLERQIQWGDEVFSVSATVASRAALTLVPVNYRFSVVKSDRVDVGLSAGVFALFADAAISAPELGVAEAESADFPLPVLGADVDVALAPGLFLLGGFEYFGLNVEGVDGAWSELRAAIEFYPVRNLGVGAGYRNVALRIDGTGALGGPSSGTEIFFDYAFRGPHVYATISF